jgi:hypothetical protein
MTDVGALSGIVEMSILSLGSLGYELQRMYQATFGQLNLETILALRLRVAQRCIRSFLENGLCRWLACEFSFSLSRPPGLRSHTAERDARTCDFSARRRQHDCSRGEREFIRSAIAQFNIERATARRWRRQCHMCNQIARF